MLGTVDGVAALIRAYAHQGQPAFLCDTPGRGVGGHDMREYTLYAQAGESHADQGARSLGGVSLVPRGPAQPVAQVDIGDVGAVAGPEVEPAEELPGDSRLGPPRYRAGRTARRQTGGTG
jgi:hypothetical protein